MDVSLNDVNDHIQKFVHKLIEINDWTFYKVHVLDEVLDYPLCPPKVTLGHVLNCFGNSAESNAHLEFTATPAKGPHACGTLNMNMADPVQFYLGSSGIQLYLSPAVELWYLVGRGFKHNAVKMTTFDRLGLIFADGRHRGIRTIIMDTDRIDLRMSDEEDDVISLYVVN